MIQSLRDLLLNYMSLPSLYLCQILYLHTTAVLDITRAIYLIALDTLDLRLLVETLHAHEVSPASLQRIRYEGE